MITRKEFYGTIFLLFMFFSWFSAELTQCIRKDIWELEKNTEWEIRQMIYCVLELPQILRAEKNKLGKNWPAD